MISTMSLAYAQVTVRKLPAQLMQFLQVYILSGTAPAFHAQIPNAMSRTKLQERADSFQGEEQA